MNDEDNGLLTIDELRSLAWKPLHMATDCVLDMMTQLQVDLQAQADRVKKSHFLATYRLTSQTRLHFSGFITYVNNT